MVAGHGRLDALVALKEQDKEPPENIRIQKGEWQVPVIRGIRFKDKKELEAYLIADNQTTIAGGWDEVKLAEILEQMQPDLQALTAFEPTEIKELIANLPRSDLDPSKEDVIPEVSDAISKLGDIWQLGPHRIMCGDSKMDIHEVLGGVQPDIILTDPPYGMNLDTKFSAMANPNDSGVSKDYLPVTGDNESFHPNFLFQSFPSIREMFLFGADYYAEELPNRNEGSWFVWDKTGGHESAEQRFGSNFELIWSKSKHKRMILRFMWKGKFGFNEDTKIRVHPTQKPTELFEWFITEYDAQSILDPFLGSGTTLIAAEKLSRICYGMEIEPKYVDVCVKRWENYTGRKAELVQKT